MDEQSVYIIHSYVTYGLKYNIVRKLYKHIMHITHINVYACICVCSGVCERVYVKVRYYYVSDNSGFLCIVLVAGQGLENKI